MNALLGKPAVAPDEGKTVCSRCTARGAGCGDGASSCRCATRPFGAGPPGAAVGGAVMDVSGLKRSDQDGPDVYVWVTQSQEEADIRWSGIRDRFWVLGEQTEFVGPAPRSQFGLMNALLGKPAVAPDDGKTVCSRCTAFGAGRGDGASSCRCATRPSGPGHPVQPWLRDLVGPSLRTAAADRCGRCW